MDYKIYKINNGYKVGRKDGKRLCSKYENRLYITKKPMRREGAKRLLMKLQLEERGDTIQVKSKKKRICDGYIRIDPIRTKRNKQLTYNDIHIDLDFIYDEIIFWDNDLKVGKIGTMGTKENPIKFCDDPVILNTFKSI
mgnify:FL=1|tara:strand:+ start:2206 stop:2622 length:417 start_codon:yes stop_codon:yes gene_type:complete